MSAFIQNILIIIQIKSIQRDDETEHYYQIPFPVYDEWVSAIQLMLYPTCDINIFHNACSYMNCND